MRVQDSLARGLAVAAALMTIALTHAQVRTAEDFIKRVPPADESKYKAVRDARAWKNPFIVVSADHVDVYSPEINHRSSTIPELAKLLIGLDATAWPYGRVAGLQENGVRGQNDGAAITKGFAEAVDVLKNLQIVPDPWPSAGPTSFPPPRVIADTDAYAVYAVLLPNEWVVTTAHATRLLIAQEASRDRVCEPKPDAVPDEWRSTVENYSRENFGIRLVESGHDIGLPYVVASNTEIRAAFSAGSADSFGYDGLDKRFPGSGNTVMSFSAVGFNADKTRAMVYVAHHCGSLCGGGMHHFLVKSDSGWHEVRPRMPMCTWVS